jgi:hypothetical protein
MSKQLQFSNYDFEKFGYMPAPPPSLNGGLYNGQPFYKDSPYRNFPREPDTTEYLQNGLPDDAPLKARYMYPPTRQGNSFVEWRGLNKYKGTQTNHGVFNLYCAPCQKVEKRVFCDDLCKEDQNEFSNYSNCIERKENNDFDKYAYIDY